MNILIYRYKRGFVYIALFVFVSGKFFDASKFTVDLDFGFLLIKSCIKM